jgi:uncharacterized protein YeaO (DUF488 family)
MLDIFTAQYRYNGPNRLDITVSSKNNTWGRMFAPTWDMVMGHKRGILSDAEYTEQYHTLMHSSMAHYKQHWTHLFNMPCVVPVCFCPAGAFCHRVVLATMIQSLNRGVYRGEIQI